MCLGQARAAAEHQLDVGIFQLSERMEGFSDVYVLFEEGSRQIASGLLCHDRINEFPLGVGYCSHTLWFCCRSPACGRYGGFLC